MELSLDEVLELAQEIPLNNWKEIKGAVFKIEYRAKLINRVNINCGLEHCPDIGSNRYFIEINTKNKTLFYNVENQWKSGYLLNGPISQLCDSIINREKDDAIQRIRKKS